MTVPPDQDLEARHRENLRAVYHGLNAPPEGAPRRSSGPRWLMRLGPVGAAIAFALGKLKLLGALATVLKLKTVLTMALTIGVYTTQWGFPFALGFVLLIFVHELGHVLMLRAEGIPASAPVFIPFVGAFVAMRGHPRDGWSTAKVAIAGPVLGSIGAWVTLGAGIVLHHPMLVALGRTGLFLNLFNLIPVRPLDGGLLMSALPRAFSIAGFAVGVAAWLALRSTLLLIVLVVGLIGLVQRWRAPHDGPPITVARRAAAFAAWLGLALAIAVTLVRVR